MQPLALQLAASACPSKQWVVYARILFKLHSSENNGPNWTKDECAVRFLTELSSGSLEGTDTQKVRIVAKKFKVSQHCLYQQTARALRLTALQQSRSPLNKLQFAGLARSSGVIDRGHPRTTKQTPSKKCQPRPLIFAAAHWKTRPQG